MNKQSFFILIVIYIGLSFTANAQVWTQIGSDIDGEAAEDRSAWSSSINSDGSIVAIGAYLNDGTGIDAGHVRVYRNIAGTWTQLGNDIDGEAAGDHFGYSVSLSADGLTLAVGAVYNDGINGINSGHARIYQYISGAWSQIGNDIDGEADGDRFGWYIGLSSDALRVAVGAYGNNGNGNDAGHVRVYENIAGIWTQIGNDIDGDGAGDHFGSDLAINSDGSIFIAGGRNFDGIAGSDCGHIQVYENIGGIWTQIGNDIEGAAAGDQFGWNVCINSDGSIVAAGAKKNDGNGIDAGHVRVYENIAGTWTQIGADILGEAAGDYSGNKLSLNSDGTKIAIGAVDNDGTGVDAGHVRVYEYMAGTWTQTGPDIDGEATNDNSGRTADLSSDGLTLSVGAYLNDGSGNDAGHIRVYKFVMPPTISIQPANQTNICSETSTEFSLTATEVDTYQWQISTDGGSFWSDLSNDATYSGVLTTTLIVFCDISLNNNQYRCYLTNTSGNATSDAAELTLIETVSNPLPANLATGISINQVLSWTASVGALSYDVYFGESGL